MALRASLVAILLLSSLGLASALGASAASSAAVLGLTAAEKNRPVTKVITLLKDMLKQLETEASNDEEIYDKMACWCETNDKEKTKSIADAKDRIDNLEIKIEELTALSAQLNSMLKKYEKEVAKDQSSLSTATELREDHLEEFNSEEQDLLQSISDVKAAMAALAEHQPRLNSLLQVSSSRASTVAMILQKTMLKHADLLKGSLTPAQRRMAMAFIQAPDTSYKPASGEIYGVLGQMLDEFERNLKNSQKEENTEQHDYSDLSEAKTEEIITTQDQYDAKTQELADTDEKLAQAKEDLIDTKASLTRDEEFLLMLKEKCSMSDKEWEERQKTRQLEMQAVSKALAFLSGDEAHDLFTKTFNFMQTAASTSVREKASKVLAAVARKFSNPRLSALSTKVRLDAFTKVKEAINDMISQLAKEKAEEIKHKDFCVDELATNKLQTEKKKREEKDFNTQIEDLEMAIKELSESVDNLKAEIAEMQVQMKRAGEDREKENKEFQSVVADQRATQKLLKAALGVLQEFYGKSALLQQEPAGPPPPAGFESYENNAQSGGVMSMIEQIITDAKAMESEAIRSEEDGQKTYESFVKETNASIETKSKEIVNKSEEKAKKEGELVEAKRELDGTMTELEQLATVKGELHQSCDFVLKNFDVRQTARDEEVEALKQAMAILSGAKFE